MHLLRGTVTPDVGASSFTVELPVSHNRTGWTATATLSDTEGPVATTTTRVDSTGRRRRG